MGIQSTLKVLIPLLTTQLSPISASILGFIAVRGCIASRNWRGIILEVMDQSKSEKSNEQLTNGTHAEGEQDEDNNGGGTGTIPVLQF